MASHKKVALITHTGSDMPLDEAAGLGISIIPDKVLFGDEEYRNMTEISSEMFYEKLAAAEKLPTSSQPSLGDFVKAYRKAAEEADEVLCLMITSKMSGCYAAALSAAQMVRAAAELAGAGFASSEIMAELDRLQPRMGVYVVLDSLENARKGGRVGAVTAMAAEALGIKPVLVFRDGLVRDHALAMNYENGLKKVLDIYEKEADRSLPVTVFHGAAPDRAQLLREMIEAVAPDVQIRMEMVGPVIGIYAGSGCAGIAFTKKESV